MEMYASSTETKAIQMLQVRNNYWKKLILFSLISDKLNDHEKTGRLTMK